MNKYQKYLNMRAKRLFKSTDSEGQNYRECRMRWHYALQNFKHYIVMLEDFKITRR